MKKVGHHHDRGQQLKAILCDAPRALSIVEREQPVAGPGEVLLKVARVGLCGTDYHIYSGTQPFLTYPRVMGHEISGTVAAIGEGSAFRIGQLVTINPYLACDRCRACRRAKPNCCSNISVLGVHQDGAMTEYVCVPESALIDATGLTPEQAAMVEFLAIGAHAVARSDLRRDDRVLVVGAGPIGVAAALFATLDGANVTLIDRQQPRLEHARDKVGIGNTLLVSDRIAEELATATDGEFFDCVFDATGNIKAMSAGLAYVAHGGSYVLISVVKDDLTFPDPEFHKRETTLLGSRNATAADFARVIAAIRSGDLPMDKLHTHSIDMADLPQGMPRLIEHAGSILKAIVAV